MAENARDTDSIVHMALYVTRSDGEPDHECFVGYDRYDNTIATTPDRRAPWVRRLLARNGDFVQTHHSAPGLVADKIREGERLARTALPEAIA